MDPYRELLLEIGIVLDQNVVEEKPDVVQPVTHQLLPEYQYTYEELRTCRPYGNTSYQRINHFTQRLHQITACLSTEVPEPILYYIKHRLPVPLTHPDIYAHVRMLLKGLREPFYYNLIFAIVRQLGGPSVKLSYTQERKILSQYECLSKRWDTESVNGRHKGSGRRYFPSYYLIVACLLEANDVKIPFRLPSVKDGTKLERLRELTKGLMQYI